MSQETAVVQQQLRPHERLVETVASMNYGDPITHETIASIIGERAGTNKYRSIVRKASKILRNKGKMIESIRSIGYRVTRPENYLDHVINNTEIATRRITTAKEIADSTPTDQLNQQQLTALRQITDTLTITYAYMTGKSVEVKTLARPRRAALAPENTNRR